MQLLVMEGSLESSGSSQQYFQNGEKRLRPKEVGEAGLMDKCKSLDRVSESQMKLFQVHAVWSPTGLPSSFHRTVLTKLEVKGLMS